LLGRWFEKVKFQEVHHLSRTAEGLCVTIGNFSSEDFLDEHHSFNEIEAVHPLWESSEHFTLAANQETRRLRSPRIGPDFRQKSKSAIEMLRQYRQDLALGLQVSPRYTSLFA
jgi:hypothetical protein